MENLTLKVAKIVGTPNLTSWSQIHTFFPEDEKKRKKRGSLFAVLSFSSQEKEGQEVITVGREILSRFHEEYFGETDEPPMKALVKAVEQVVSEFSGDEQKLEIVAATFVENALYLAIAGAGEVWVKRDVFGKVLAGKTEKVESASGFLKEGDLVVLGTTAFFELVGNGVFKAALENGDPQEAVESLAPLIQGKKQAHQTACVIGKVEITETEEQEAEAEILKQPAASLFSFFRRISLPRPREDPKRKKTIFAIALILLFLLTVSIVLGVKKTSFSQKEEQYQQLSGEISRLIEQGEALLELNSHSSREFFLQAQANFSDLEKLKIEPEKTNELKKRLETLLVLATKEYQLNEVPLFTDLSLISAGGRGNSLALYKNNLTILDKDRGRVFLLGTEKKSGEVLSGGDDLEKPQFLTVYDNFVFVFENEGIAEIVIKTKKTQRSIIKKDQEWGEIAAIGAFGGNLYLLDKGENAIWRYQRIEGDFGSKQAWLGKDVSPDFSSAVSMAIDGSIWILTSEGRILKFTRGAMEAFSITGLEKPLSKTTRIYTDDEVENLYLLDKGNARVVVLAKSGKYQAEYLWPGISDVSDMVVSETEKKIFLLSGSKIYEVTLR